MVTSCTWTVSSPSRDAIQTAAPAMEARTSSTAAAITAGRGRVRSSRWAGGEAEWVADEVGRDPSPAEAPAAAPASPGSAWASVGASAEPQPGAGEP